MSYFQFELQNIGIFVGISFMLALILLVVVYILSFSTKIDYEKSSVYECGFQPFSEANYPFEVQFALIAIMFLLFDIEILYLYPLGTSILHLHTIELLYIVGFFMIISLGILYEVSRNVVK